MATNHNPLGLGIDPESSYYVLAAADRPDPLYVSLPVALDGGCRAESYVMLALAATEDDAHEISRAMIAAGYGRCWPVQCAPEVWRECWAKHARSVGAVLLDRKRMPAAVLWTKGHAEEPRP